tara:strand:- start:130 stop:357 length:228 start_codon:yes stop_codon:yes gene_type:complete
MDSLQSHPSRVKVKALWDKLARVRDEEKRLLKLIATTERESREACNTNCLAEDKWTRDNYPYAELYCRICGVNKR